MSVPTSSTLLALIAPTLTDEQLGALARQLVRTESEDRALGAQLRALLEGSPAAPPRKAQTAFRQVKFRLPDGTRSNVTLRASLFQALIERTGSRQAATEQIRRLATRVPANVVNRSGWVADELTKWLAQAQPQSAQQGVML